MVDTSDSRRQQRLFYGLMAVVSVAGIAVLALLVAERNGVRGSALLRGILLLAPGVIAGELVPIKIPRRGEAEAITFSTTFAFALLLVCGPLPACLALAAASVIQDLLAHKPWWRILFNVGQYTLCISAAALCLSLFTDVPVARGHQPFATTDIPGIVLAGAALFFVNVSIVGTAVALFTRTPIGVYFRRDLAFTMTTGLVLLCLGPIVVAALEFSWALIPLFVFPVIATYQFGRRTAADAQHAALHDSLTGLASRAHLADVIEESLETQRSRDTGFAVMLLDLDRFKSINDSFGHHLGDRVLTEAARRMARTIGADGTAARLGGDEFVIVTRSLESQSDVVAIAERLHKALRSPLIVDEMALEIDASIGIAYAPEDGRTVAELLARADDAMYSAKRSATRTAIYRRAVVAHRVASPDLVPALRRSIEGDELEVWYQPKLDLAGGRFYAVEALARLRRDGRMVPPEQFIPLAESTGLIKPLTVRVLETALAQCAEWARGGQPIEVSVNVSARSLLDEGLANDVACALAASGVAPSRLQVEITESTMMVDPEEAMRVLNELRAMGVKVAIDDFGTGFSSLSYLQRLPANEIKIDRSFVTHMGERESDALIVRSVVDLAHALGLATVAEGVEDGPVLERLRLIGCDAAQGFHLGRPAPASELALRAPGFPAAPDAMLARVVPAC